MARVATPAAVASADLVYAFSVIEWLADWMRLFWSRTSAQAWARVQAQEAAADLGGAKVVAC